MERLIDTGDSKPAAPEIDDDKARLIGEILRDYVSSLGPDRAMTPDAVVRITPAADREGSGGARPSRAILDATSGGDAGRAVLSHRNLVAPQHGQAANPERCSNSERHSAKGTVPFVAVSIERAVSASGKRCPAAYLATATCVLPICSAKPDWVTSSPARYAFRDFA